MFSSTYRSNTEADLRGRNIFLKAKQVCLGKRGRLSAGNGWKPLDFRARKNIMVL